MSRPTAVWVGVAVVTIALVVLVLRWCYWWTTLPAVAVGVILFLLALRLTERYDPLTERYDPRFYDSNGRSLDGKWYVTKK